jgi:hypothetical protein
MGGNGHDLLFAAVRIVSPAEGDATVFEGHESMVGDGDAMGITGQVVENVLGAAEGRLGVDDPVFLTVVSVVFRINCRSVSELFVVGKRFASGPPAP